MKPKRLKLVLCWHMHQPHYRDALDGTYRLPWVYLHAIKDYSDMVWHLELCPDAHVVVNFAPVLLEQLSDYQQQMRCWLESGEPMRDPLLNLLSGVTPVGSDSVRREEIVRACQRAYAPTMIDSLPRFRQLLDAVHCAPAGTALNETVLHYLNETFFTDLLVWYHLAWMGSGLRQTDRRVAQLLAHSGSFSPQDRRLLVEVMADALAALVPRYRALMERGQIELSMTPYGHPIAPLLIDFISLRDAMPDAPAPVHACYPQGEARVKWHLQQGLDVFRQHFGIRPKGVWLAEGALSAAAISLLDEYGMQWTASGEGVWRHSCEASQIDPHDLSSKKALYQPMQHADQRCALFFRDDGLSDLIGFQYQTWPAEDAARDFVQHLENIARFLGEEVEEHVVSVILDGENAWEYYPHNAQDFLSALYRQLSSHPQLQMTTFSEALQQGVGLRPLPVLKAGSWVYGSFSTWIGEPDKNRAWDLLTEAKLCFDRVRASGRLSRQQEEKATLQLAVCEGSDWFWWFGDDNPAESVADFDRLFRRHLKQLYRLLNEPAPQGLDRPVSVGGGQAAHAGTMRRNG